MMDQRLNYLHANPVKEGWVDKPEDYLYSSAREVIELKVLDDYRIWLKFNDGEDKVINFRPYIGKGFTAELLDYEKFKQVFIEPGGGIAWENGYDFCPNYLKELTEEKKHVA